MQLANVIVALGGDRGNTVPKTRVTAPEIAILLAVHGHDAVFDIQPLDETVSRSVREEIDRLRQLYTARDEDNKPIVEVVYPGRTPSLHETIEELELPEELFATESRVSAKPKTSGKSRGKTKPAAAAPAPAENSADSMFDDDDEDEDKGVLA